MSYWISRWTPVGEAASIEFSIRDQDDAPTSAVHLLPVPGGAYDPEGLGQALRAGVEQVTVRCLVGRGAVAERRAAVDAIRATIGKRGRLYRQADDDAAEWHFASARLAQLHHRRAETNRTLAELELVFETTPPWQGAFHGGSWLLDDGESLDAGLQLDEGDATFTQADGDNLVLPLSGNAVQRAVRITFTPATAISPSPGNHSFTIGVGDAFLEFYGDIGAGKSLVIDTGTFTVTNDGVDAYDDFELGSLHAVEGWLELQPGNNFVAIDVPGTPNYTLTFEYRDAWH